MEVQGSADGRVNCVRDWVRDRSRSIFWVYHKEHGFALEVLSAYIDMAGYLQMFFEVGNSPELYKLVGILKIQIYCEGEPVFERINVPLPLDIRHGIAKIHAKVDPDPFLEYDKNGGVLMDISLTPEDVTMKTKCFD